MTARGLDNGALTKLRTRAPEVEVSPLSSRFRAPLCPLFMARPPIVRFKAVRTISGWATVIENIFFFGCFYENLPKATKICIYIRHMLVPIEHGYGSEKSSLLSWLVDQQAFKLKRG